jgi:hypothetical protein
MPKLLIQALTGSEVRLRLERRDSTHKPWIERVSVVVVCGIGEDFLSVLAINKGVQEFFFLSPFM